MSLATEENQIEFVDRYFEEKIEIDYWWMDAGWYSFHDYWLSLERGSLIRSGFRADFVQSRIMCIPKAPKSFSGFVPERADPGEWLYENHPEWLLGINGGRNFSTLVTRSLGSGQWNHFDSLFIEQGADLFRMDGDGPLPFWRQTIPKTAKELRKSDMSRASWHFGRTAAAPSRYADGHLRRRRRSKRT